MESIEVAIANNREETIKEICLRIVASNIFLSPQYVGRQSVEKKVFSKADIGSNLHHYISKLADHELIDVWKELDLGKQINYN